jgi:hypothetical protein
MIGSYAPQEKPYEKKFATEQAPSGMLARGHYVVRSKFFDDDKTVHLDWEWVRRALQPDIDSSRLILKRTGKVTRMNNESMISKVSPQMSR